MRSENDYGRSVEEKMAAKRADYFAAGTLVVWDVDLQSAEVVRKWNAEVNAIMQSADIKQRLLAEGARFAPNTPEQFAASLKKARGTWSAFIRRNNIVAQQ